MRPTLLLVVSLSSLLACSDAAPSPLVRNDAGNETGIFYPGDAAAVGCVTDTISAAPVPIGVFITLDRSGSMLEGGKWQSTQSAISAFVSDRGATGVSVGMQYFPQFRLCAIDAYASPAVPMVQLPAGAPRLMQSLLEQQPFGGTPMVPALTGAIGYARDWSRSNPDKVAVVLLATDGIPDATCDFAPDGGVENSVDGVVTIAQRGTQAVPSISTFVIGVGSALTDLHRIAAAGGTREAFLIDTSHDVQKDFVRALSEIRTSATLCQFTIPPQKSGLVDFGKVNVELTANTAASPKKLSRVSDPKTCDANGWYYDVAEAPTRILLCPDVCGELRANPQEKVDIVVGCKTATVR